MLEITFLGTSASVPSITRGLSSLLLRHQGRRFLIDCGEGTQRQLLSSGLGLRRLEAALLTHGHVDHLLGLGGLVSTLGLWRASNSLTIHAGKQPLRLARRLLETVVWDQARPNIAIDYHEVAAGPVLTVGGLSIVAFPVQHGAPDCYGYRFDTAPRRSLRLDRIAELRVPSGPERAALLAGRSITMADGRSVDPEEVLGPMHPGVSLAVVGDAGETEDLVVPVSGADLLVIEATFLEQDAAKARERKHLTALRAARLARDAAVGHLCLTHLSARYRPAAILAEARAEFERTTLAEDFLTLQVTAGQVVTSRREPVPDPPSAISA